MPPGIMSPRHVINDQSPNIRAPVHLTEEVHSFIESGDIFADCRGKTRKLLTERHGNGIVQCVRPSLTTCPGDDTTC
jgi:hypothetical protein